MPILLIFRLVLSIHSFKNSENFFLLLVKKSVCVRIYGQFTFLSGVSGHLLGSRANVLSAVFSNLLLWYGFFFVNGLFEVVVTSSKCCLLPIKRRLVTSQSVAPTQLFKPLFAQECDILFFC